MTSTLRLEPCEVVSYDASLTALDRPPVTGDRVESLIVLICPTMVLHVERQDVTPMQAKRAVHEGRRDDGQWLLLHAAELSEHPVRHVRLKDATESEGASIGGGAKLTCKIQVSAKRYPLDLSLKK